MQHSHVALGEPSASALGGPNRGTEPSAVMDISHGVCHHLWRALTPD